MPKRRGKLFHDSPRICDVLTNIAWVKLQLIPSACAQYETEDMMPKNDSV